VTRLVERLDHEAITVALWKEKLCEGFRSLPGIESLQAVITAWLERQFPRPVAR
jgi:hypothetical protein